ncbi:MAG: diguanylate cyclase [Sedimenticola sp.]|nr:diguanylate cyclase [Sedimenticola sp.]
MKILLVDDTKSERLLMTAHLESLGHTVVSGINGQQALELYQSVSPDLVLLDVIMPVLDGHQVAREIRNSFEEWVPIIFLSGRNNPDDIVAGIESGGDDYLTKPVDLKILKAKMSAMQRIANMRHKLIAVTQELENANQELQQMADSDGLTGIANRRCIDEYLVRMHGHCRRYKQPLSLIMLDIDHFKAYNDTYGHLAGDSCLKKMAKVMKLCVKRPIDLAGRYGGEEFCIILPDTDQQGVLRVAKLLQNSIHKMAIPHTGSITKPFVTFSAGCITAIPDEQTDTMTLFARADEALYIAKKNGRDQIQQISL